MGQLAAERPAKVSAGQLFELGTVFDSFLTPKDDC